MLLALPGPWANNIVLCLTVYNISGRGLGWQARAKNRRKRGGFPLCRYRLRVRECSSGRAGQSFTEIFCFLSFRSDDQQKTRPSNDLLDLDFGNPTATGGTVPLAGAAASASSLAQPPPPPRTVGGSIDPWGMPGAASALAGAAVANNDPWGASAATQAAPEPKPINNDPWSPVGAAPTSSAMRTSPAAAMAMSTSPVGMHHNQASSVIIQQSSGESNWFVFTW